MNWFYHFKLQLLYFIGLQVSLNCKNPKTYFGRYLKNNLLDNTNKRFEGVEKQTLMPYFSNAILLDPRCKKAAFALENNKTEAEKSIISEVASLMHNTTDTGKHTVNFTQYFIIKSKVIINKIDLLHN